MGTTTIIRLRTWYSVGTDCEELAYSGSEGSKRQNDSMRWSFWQLVPPGTRTQRQGHESYRIRYFTRESKEKGKVWGDDQVFQ